MQDKTWYSILGLDAEPLFLQDHMLKTFPFIYFSNAAKQELYIHAKMNLIKIKVPKLGNQVP